MTQILSLTSYSQIRGVITVSERDLPDEVLQAMALEDDLEADLLEWLPEWESLSDVAEAQRLRLFAKYFCAGNVADMAQVFVLKKDTDGSNEGQRSDVDGFKELAQVLKAKAQMHKAALANMLGIQVSRTYSQVSVSSPARDVITEARADAPQ